MMAKKPFTSDEELLRLAKWSGDPWKATNPYFAHAEAFTDRSWAQTIWPFISDCDFSSVVDLAAGHGRNSSKLLKLAGFIYILDIQPSNIEVCRKRFSSETNVLFAVNNGYDFEPVPSDWAALVYCFDAMVHFDTDVIRSYLRDAKRVLRVGGRGFFHHSNYTEGDADWTKGPHSRNFMSSHLFRHYAQKEGLRLVRQKIIDWGSHPQLDCLSLVERVS